jgi:heptosyltransferase III
MRAYCGTPKETIPMRIMDFFIDIYTKTVYRRPKNRSINPSPRILLASLGHLGDALTTSYLFPIIKKQYPNAQIDLITPEWTKLIYENNAYLNQVIYINHWVNNRKAISTWQKLKEHYRTFKNNLKTLQQNEYDYYIDIRYSDAVAHFVLPFIKVKKAFGFSRRGLGGLLDKEFDVPNREFHHYEMNLLLLKEIGIEANLNEVKAYFEIPERIDFEVISKKINLKSQPYILILPEAGAEIRQVSVNFMAQIVNELITKSDIQFIFCGQTDLSAKIIEQVSDKSRVIDSSNQLSILEIARLSQQAQHALTLDSFPEHLCCIFCPTTTIYKVSIAFYPIANHPVLLIYGHQLSEDLIFERENVSMHYKQNIETEEVREMIVGNIIMSDKR